VEATVHVVEMGKSNTLHWLIYTCKVMRRSNFKSFSLVTYWVQWRDDRSKYLLQSLEDVGDKKCQFASSFNSLQTQWLVIPHLCEVWWKGNLQGNIKCYEVYQLRKRLLSTVGHYTVVCSPPCWWHPGWPRSNIPSLALLFYHQPVVSAFQWVYLHTY